MIKTNFMDMFPYCPTKEKLFGRDIDSYGVECKRCESGVEFIVKLPGVGKDNVSVSSWQTKSGIPGYRIEIDDNAVLDEYKSRTYYIYTEFEYDHFLYDKKLESESSTKTSSFTFPVNQKIDVDKTDVSIKDGLLRICVPFYEKSVENKKFEIK